MNMSRLIELAATQGGFASRRQLLSLGLTSSAIGRAVNRGEIAIVADGVYRVIPMEGEEALLRGAVLALPGAVVSHFSAARLWGFPYLRGGPPTVSVHHRTTHEFPGVTVRRTIDLSETHTTTLRGMAITTPARTASDLAADLHIFHLDRVVDGILVAGMATIDEMNAIGLETGRRGKPGTVKFREVLADRGDGFMASATVLERLGHAVLRRYGVRTPVPQYPIPWSPSRRFDDAYPEVRLAIEWDSRRWHAALEQMAKDRERDRECAMHAWTLMRFTWHDLKQRPDVVANQVRVVLEQRQAG
jgi:hypothetical protein